MPVFVSRGDILSPSNAIPIGRGGKETDQPEASLAISHTHTISIPFDTWRSGTKVSTTVCAVCTVFCFHAEVGTTKFWEEEVALSTVFCRHAEVGMIQSSEVEEAFITVYWGHAEVGTTKSSEEEASEAEFSFFLLASDLQKKNIPTCNEKCADKIYLPSTVKCSNFGIVFSNFTPYLRLPIFIFIFLFLMV
jgi:hypothetical protein